MNTSFYQTISWKEKKKLIKFELLFFLFFIHFFLPFCGDVFPPVKINGIIIYLEMYMYMYYRLSHADKFFAHVLVYLYFYFNISFLSS